jgi:hypothetical protein
LRGGVVDWTEKHSCFAHLHEDFPSQIRHPSQSGRP